MIIHAAVAVLIRHDGNVLLARRPEGKPWAGWWEFPGGKMEEGESALEALQRELQEELGIQTLEAYPWLTRTFSYPEKTVRLNFFMVRKWLGEPYAKEGQLLSWQIPSALNVSPMLPANEPVLLALSLPSVYALTNMAELGEAEFLQRLQAALDQGLQLIQVREKQLQTRQLRKFLDTVLTLAKPYGARVLLNQDVEMAISAGADGVHLPSAQLMVLSEKPSGLLCAASCHTPEELLHAQQLGMDFVVVSPVLPTLSHPQVQALGWQHFAEMISGCAIPVYALGGMHMQHQLHAWQHGAHGIAMQRAIWQ